MSSAPDLPRKLGRYTLLSRLHGGGMTEVYAARLAEEVGPGRMLVIKILPTTYRDNPEAEARFLEEARIVLNLTHGNITAAFEFGREEGRPFLVMEYVPGPSLHRLLDLLKKDGKKQQVQDALFIAREVCRALSYAHTFAVPGSSSRGLVHRDISPDNILISISGQVKLTDFGIALFSRSGQFGPIWGKAAYIAPEVIVGQKLTPSSDIYSLGAVLYECLTGRVPFIGKDVTETLQLVRSTPPRPPSAHREECVEEVDQLVLRLLDKQPEGRPSASALVGQLSALLASTGDTYAEPALAQNVSEYCSEDDYLSPGRGQQIRAVVLQAGGLLRGENTGEIIAGNTVPLDDSVQSLPAEQPVNPAGPNHRTLPRILVGAGVVFLLAFVGFLFFSPDPPSSSTLGVERPDLAMVGTHSQPKTTAKISSDADLLSDVEPVKSNPEETEKHVKKNETKSNRGFNKRRIEPSTGRNSATKSVTGSPKFGWVNINSYPWSYVTIDGKKLDGHTPHKKVKLKAGSHNLVFENPKLGLRHSREIEVGADEETNIGVRLENKK